MGGQHGICGTNFNSEPPEGDYMDYVEITNTGPPQFTTSTLTKDGSWHDLDFTGFVPAGTKAVNLRYKALMAAIGADSRVRFRKYGSTSTQNNCLIRPQVNGRYITGLLILGLSTDLKIQYEISAETWDVLDLHIRGYFI